MSNPAQNLLIPTKSLDIPAQLIVPPGGAAPAADDSPEAAAGAGRRPALVVLHDHYGLDETTLDAAARLSEFGYVVLCPDLYARSGGPHDTTSEVAITNFTMTLVDSNLIADTLAALNWIVARADVAADRVGLVGWGWGGAYALMGAAHDDRLRAVVDIGGTITYPVQTAQRPGSPLNFAGNVTGACFAAFAGRDPACPPPEVARLAGRLRERDGVDEVKVYPDAPPRFWRDDALPQTAQLWRRLRTFLQANLDGAGSSDAPPED